MPKLYPDSLQMQPQTLQTEALEIYDLKMIIHTLPSTPENPAASMASQNSNVMEALLQTKLLLLCSLLVYIVKQ